MVAVAGSANVLAAANLLIEVLDGGAVGVALEDALRSPAASIVALAAIAHSALGSVLPAGEGRAFLMDLSMREELAELLAEHEGGSP